MRQAGGGRRTVALGASLFLAAGGIACLVSGFEVPEPSRATDVSTVSLERQAVIAAVPARTDFPTPISTPADEPVPAAAADPVDLAVAIERLLFDAGRPLSAAELDALVVAGRFARADVTLAALRRLILDARGSERLVAPGEAAAALRADPARSLAVLELAAEYADVPTDSPAHARLRELLDGWPPALGKFVALLAADANDVERLASDALVSGGDAGRDALGAALSHWMQGRQGVEAAALVRALLASSDAASAAAIVARSAEGLGDPLSGIVPILATSRRRLGPADERWADELLRLAAETASQDVKRLALWTVVEGQPASPIRRAFAESIVRDGGDLMLVSQAMSVLGSTVPPSDLIALGKSHLRTPEAGIVIAMSLGRSLQAFPHDRAAAAELLRSSFADGSIPTDVALVLAERLSLAELEPDIEAIAASEAATDDLRANAQCVLDRFRRPLAEFAPHGETADAATVAAVRAAETALRHLRLEGVTTIEKWDAGEGRLVYAGESEWTAHYPGTPGGRERVHFHRRIRPSKNGPAPLFFSEEILAFDGRVDRSLELGRGTPDSIEPALWGRLSPKRRGDQAGMTGTGWSHTLFGLGSNGIRVSDLLEWPGYAVRRDGDGCLVIEPAKSGYWLRVDPGLGFAVVESGMLEGRQVFSRYEVHEFRDAGDGIHFPARATWTRFASDGTTRERIRFECRLAAANEPNWGDEVFRLDFPDGTSVDDEIAGGRFVAGAKVGAAGEEPVPPTPVAVAPAPTPPAPASAASEADTPILEPQPAPPVPEPPGSRAPWLAAGIALLATAAVLGAVSRRRPAPA